ncbi:ubiquitin-like protein Pup [Ornithinimicrobium sp. Arc0846-15]|nr:ubiquitin-like protein Pup [Ornithinimicrobium laminariae]
MSGQEQQRRNTPEPEEPTPPAPAQVASEAKKDAELDSFLDEIDGVLETNAQEFVHGFVQKGGQ